MLAEQRKELDQLDQKLQSLLTKRLQISGKIAEIKLQHNLPVLDQDREKQIQTQIKKDVDPQYQTYIADLFTDIMLVSKQYQAQVIKKKQDK